MDIQEIAERIKEYFDKHIIPDESMTVVETVDANFVVNHKGHGMSFRIRNSNCAPIYYVEDVIPTLQEGHTIEAIAESINAQIKDSYQQIMDIEAAQSKGRSVKDLDIDNVIVSIRQTNSVPDTYANDIYRKDYDTGISVFLKAPISTEFKNMYIDIQIDETLSKTETDKLWENAMINTYRNTPIGVTVNKDNPFIMISDQAHFSPLFYMYFTDLYKSLAEQADFCEIYVVPCSPYEAMVIGVPYENDENEEYIAFIKDTVEQLSIDYSLGKEDDAPNMVMYDTIFGKIMPVDTDI